MLQSVKELKNATVKGDLIDVLHKESDSILYLAKNFPVESEILVREILNAKGRIVFSGMGKSGCVARKLVATFSGLGIPSLFLHPSEALHGDLGSILPEDLIIAISKSGTGKEFEQIIPVLKSSGNFTSLICCADGKLKHLVDLTIKLPFKEEACVLNLAPTSSSTLCIAFGDALAIVVSKLKGFGRKDFAKIHPSGALGKRLLLKVGSMMVKEESLPLVFSDTRFQDLLHTITTKKLGVAIVVNRKQELLGVVTDGDLRRACNLGSQVFDKTAIDIMTINPKAADQGILAVQALQLMEKFNITSLVVTSGNGKVIGLVHIHDLVKAGIV